MTGRGDTLVSVLVPAMNEAANVGRAYAEITRVFDSLPDYRCEIIFTDNHSTDATFTLLSAIASVDPRVRVIRFARNIGYQRSLLVAYQNARGACSVQIDCDLQDPPDLIPQMLTRWREGHQVVYGIRRSLAESRIKAALRRWFYYGINALSEDDLPLNAGEFRLVDGRLLAELRAVQDTSPYLRGLISSMGFSQVGFEYDRGARVAGESKFPLSKMLGLAADGVLNHSLVPLRVASGVGLEHYRDYIKQLYRERGWTHGIDFVPHDAVVKELGTGRTRVETMKALGLSPQLAPNASLDDGRNAVRQTLPLTVFHPRCDEGDLPGIGGLEQYRREWDDEKKTFKRSAVEDWTTDIADSFRYLSLSWRKAPPREIKVPKLEGWRIPPPNEAKRGGIQL